MLASVTSTAPATASGPASTNVPVVTTQAPVVTTQAPATTTQPLATTTQPPATTTQPPATTTQPPATTTQAPATTQPPTTSAAPPSSLPPTPAGPYVSPADLGLSVGAIDPTTTVTGNMTITADNTVIEDTIVEGCIRIEADNVTIRNSVVRCGDFYPIRGISNRNLRVEYSTIDCRDTAWKGFLFDGVSDFIIDRIETTGCDDSFFIDGGLGNSSITNSVFHNQPPDADAHTDGIQLGEFDPTNGSLTIDGNWWEYNRDGCCATAAIFLTRHAAITATITNNYVDGDFGVHLLRCHGSSACLIAHHVIAFEPVGLVVHDTSTSTGLARCNIYPDGTLVPTNLINGMPVDNTTC